MWYLAGKRNEQKTSYLLCNRVYKIGRVQQTPSQNPDLALDGDTSVSRLHADILIKFTESQCTNVDSQPNVILTDHSRFGTFVNDIKVTDFKSLTNNDMIRFGMNNSCFKLHHEPLTVTTSCVNSKNKIEIKKLICQLGGHLINEWTSSCDYVIMDKLTITVKVINALITQKQIVTKKYFEELINKSADLKTTFAHAENFLPPISEENLDNVNFNPVQKRKTIFNEKLFVFFSSYQLEKMNNLISLAGGQCTIFNKRTHMNKTYLKEKKNLIFISSDEIDNEEQSYLLTALNALHRRIVDETEIGLAILHCSIEKHCNISTFEVINVQPTPPEFRIESQSIIQTDSLQQDSYRTETQYNDIVLAAFETQDSLPFEYQPDRINETRKIDDTPEKKKEKRPRLFDDDEFIKPAEIDEPKKKTKRTFKDIANKETVNNLSARLKNIKPQPKEVEIEELPMETYQENEPKSSYPLNDENKVTLTEPKPSKRVEKIKREPTVDSQTETKPLTYTKVKGLVYSKCKPENCIKNEEADGMTSQLKIKFESLIKKEYTTQRVVQQDGHKVNFKKFRKVPKATRNSQEKKPNEKFKNFKNEPFDVNSQFDSFMNSIR